MATLETHKREARRIVALVRALNNKLYRVRAKKTPELLQALADRDMAALLDRSSLLIGFLKRWLIHTEPPTKKRGLKFKED
jgi:hypothetical protein